MFFMQIMAAFLVRTDPASSMVKPAHIHITRAPQTRKEKVLKTKGGLLLDAHGVGGARAEQEEDDRGDARRGEHDGEPGLGRKPIQRSHRSHLHAFCERTIRRQPESTTVVECFARFR